MKISKRQYWRNLAVGVVCSLSLANFAFADEPVKKHVLGDGTGKDSGDGGKVTNFTKVYSRANDDTRQNESDGVAGDPFEVTMIKCQLNTVTDPKGNVSMKFNWNGQMTTGRHLGEADQYETRFVLDSLRGEKEPKKDGDTLDAERAKTLATRWLPGAGPDKSTEARRNSSMYMPAINLGTIEKSDEEKVVSGKLEIRLKNWQVLDKLYKESGGKAGFRGGVFQLIDYKVKVKNGEIIEGDVGCTRPKDPNFKLFLAKNTSSTHGKKLDEFDADSYDDSLFDQCRQKKEDKIAKEKNRSPRVFRDAKPRPGQATLTDADCEKWWTARNDPARRYREKPTGADCKEETVGAGDGDKPKKEDDVDKRNKRIAQLVNSASCARCHGEPVNKPRKGDPDFDKKMAAFDDAADKNKRVEKAGHLVCDDGRPVFPDEMLTFLAPMILKGELPTRDGGYNHGMNSALAKMMKQIIGDEAERIHKDDPKKADKVAAAKKLWDDRLELADGELPGAGLMKELSPYLETMKELVCRQSTTAGLSQTGVFKDNCGKYTQGFGGKMGSIESPGARRFSDVLQLLDYERESRFRQITALVRGLVFSEWAL